MAVVYAVSQSESPKTEPEKPKEMMLKGVKVLLSAMLDDVWYQLISSHGERYIVSRTEGPWHEHTERYRELKQRMDWEK